MIAGRRIGLSSRLAGDERGTVGGDPHRRIKCSSFQNKRGEGGLMWGWRGRLIALTTLTLESKVLSIVVEAVGWLVWADHQGCIKPAG